MTDAKEIKEYVDRLVETLNIKEILRKLSIDEFWRLTFFILLVTKENMFKED